jgi:hypothetical protein
MKLEDLLEKLRVNSYPSGRDDFHLLISRPDVESQDFKLVTDVKVDTDKKTIFLIVE